MVQFSILGPLEVRTTDTAYLGEGPFQATLLIALIVGRRKVHSADQLMDEVWGQARPSRTDNAFQAHISRLRRKLRRLEPGRPRERLALSRRSGYCLDVAEEELDAGIFLARVESLEKEGDSCPPAQVVARVREALSPWRGPALGGIVGGPICRTGALHYEEARSRALELRFDAELALGNHGGIIGELSELLAAPPGFRERYCVQLMVALYRSGRQADALNVYRRICDRAGDESHSGSGSGSGFGSGPSLALRECERAVLAHDPALDLPRQRVGHGTLAAAGGSRQRIVVPGRPRVRHLERSSALPRL